MANEVRLMDEFKSELMSKFIDLCRGNDYNKLTLLRIGETIDRIYEKYSILPTVDADMVEVVLCKDCKHYDNSEGICWCKLNSKFFPGGLDWHGFPEDGFCSYGERRTDV